MSFDVHALRQQFPALSDNGALPLFFDNPAGTQVPRSIAERMVDCLLHNNANIGGAFDTSRRAGDIAWQARVAMADFVNAPSADEIIFGQNMTTITLHLSRCMAHHFEAGDEIILSRMDHDANVQPWILMARDAGLNVRWLEFDPESFEFDIGQLDALISARTKLICVTAASNLTGTVNDVAAICRKARDAGAWTYIDAVQSAPHVVTDVQAIGCDFLVCSAYKFFGPHQGILWGRREILEQLQPYKLRPAPDQLPWRFETGTQSLEGMAGTHAAIDYLAELGVDATAGCTHTTSDDRPTRLRSALASIVDYEQGLSGQLIAGLQDIPGTRIQGISAVASLSRRVPTISFTHARHSPPHVAAELAARNIQVWSGHNYAIEAAAALGLLESGGVVRIGPVHYNTADEIDRLLNALEDVLT